MATDPRGPAGRLAPCRDDSGPDLVAQVRDHSRTVIEAELRRLARRVPSLRRADLDVIDAALEDLARSLILDRLSNAPQATVPLLRPLFDTGREP